jgi:hypothetical protein
LELCWRKLSRSKVLKTLVLPKKGQKLNNELIVDLEARK